jgi:RNA polymerase sigma-70 factor (ECF subfamily)
VAEFEAVYDQIATPVFGIVRAVLRDPCQAEEVTQDVLAETVEASLEAERVRRCLAALSEPQRRAVILTCYHGYTYRQAAALLDIPDGTLSTRIRDGLIRLHDCLGGQP